ncbi:reverse transcriptase [Lithospermum erythrorhizon]|uniref:Reverse transcriptase n=1 Tax=Lithospermum erythrorhizon TaxID=34254 RepID=A0AAV3Q8Q6_LITER
MDMSKGALPMRYLGVPLSSKNLTTEDYSVLISRVCSKIDSWQTRHLSMGGRAELIRSSIFGIQNFWCANLRLPKYVTEEVERRIRSFLWSGKGEGLYRAKISWTTACLPLSEGGLGFKRMEDWNQVCLCKMLWNIASKKETLWEKWVHTVRLKGVSIWRYKKSDRDPWFWNKMSKVRSLI